MFQLLGTIVTRFWPIVLVAWLLLLVGSGLFAPSWDTITQDGDVAFLSENSPSRQGDLLFQKAFPDQYTGTSIVLVISRPTGNLRDEDQLFLEQTLGPELNKIAEEKKGPGSLILRIRTPAEG